MMPVLAQTLQDVDLQGPWSQTTRPSGMEPLDVWLFTNSHLCQFIEIVHKIIKWYMKNAKLLFVSVI